MSHKDTYGRDKDKQQGLGTKLTLYFTKGEKIMSGWISIHRQIQEHWIWKSKEPFDKRSAWIDLLLLVNHQTEKIEFDNKIIEVERGQRITSLEKLATRWKWSRHKVSDFLNNLEQDGMLVQIRDKKKTLVSIENYNKYQVQEKSSDMSEDMRKDISRTCQGHKQ